MRRSPTYKLVIKKGRLFSLISRELIHKLVYQIPEYSLNSAFEYLTQLSTNDEPTCLYHYAKPEGLMGIFDSKKLFVTQSSRSGRTFFVKPDA